MTTKATTASGLLLMALLALAGCGVPGVPLI